MKFSQWLGLIAFVISLYIIWQIRQLLLLLFTGVILATALNQLVWRFQRRRLSRTAAVCLSVGIVVAVLVVVIALIVPPFIDQFQQLVLLLPAGLEQVEGWLSWLQNTFLGQFIPENFELDRLIRQIQPVSTQLFNRSLTFFSTTVSVAIEAFLILAIALMLLINPHPYRAGFIRIFPSFYRKRVDGILSRCHESLGQWTIGTLIEMVFIAAMSGIGLWILRVPLVLAHAVLAGLLNLIPNIGPTLSAVLPITIALLYAPWKAIAVLILYIVIQNIESYWLTPTIMAKQVSLLPALTLTAQVFFASVFGPLGLLMALPLAVVAKIWVEQVLFEDVMDRWQHPGKSQIQD
jgi:predicted PurR-regulated permease PerM